MAQKLGHKKKVAQEPQKKVEDPQKKVDEPQKKKDIIQYCESAALRTIGHQPLYCV